MEHSVLHIEATGPFVLVKTRPGRAGLVAAVIDETGMPRCSGTLAGDDTVLIVLPAEPSSEALAAAAQVRNVEDSLPAHSDVLAVEALHDFVIVKTAPGGASSVGQAVDALGLPGISGSVAGDDVLLLLLTATPSKQASSAALSLRLSMMEDL